MFKIGVDISEIMGQSGTFNYTFVHTEVVNTIEEIIPQFKDYLNLLEVFVEKHKGEVSK